MNDMSVTKPLRVAVVNSHPIQYFAPLYAHLNRNADIEMVGLYCSDFSLRGGIDQGFKQSVTWNIDLLTGYQSKFLGARAKTRNPRGFWSIVCPEIWTEIRLGNYDALILNGYNYAAYFLAFVAAKVAGIPVLMRSETHLKLQRSIWRRRVRDGVLSVAYKFIDGFLAVGSLNRDYYLSLGVAPQRIFPCPYTVDNDRFMVAARSARKNFNEIRRRYGIDGGRPVVLYASKLSRRKHPDDVLSAIAALREERIDVTFAIVGTGEMERELRDQVRQLDLTNVVFLGFVNQAEMPLVLAVSDVFVLPAENEPWGLIVNEAMCAGLPVVVGDEIGCVPDLVRDGENGALMKAGDVASLTAAIRRVLCDPARCKAMGEASASRIASWSYNQCETGLLRALRTLCA
jgi:glycosyltransferase involved in cell wall biosynthesis